MLSRLWCVDAVSAVDFHVNRINVTTVGLQKHVTHLIFVIISTFLSILFFFFFINAQ